MAYRTISEVLIVDQIMSEQHSSLRTLIRRRRPIGIEHFGWGPQVWRRIAVAIQTPTHGQWRRLPHQRHAIDFTMTRRTPDAFGDMNGMIEVNVIGKLIHFVPVNRL